MQPQPSAQLKPGLPNIGNDPISKALAWLRTQGGNVQNMVSSAANTLVNDSVVGKMAQGKFNEVLPTLNKTVQDYAPNDLMKTGKLSQKDMENMGKVNFAGEMVEVPGAPIIKTPKATMPERIAMKVNQVDDVKLPSEVGGAQSEARMQNTLNRVVPGGNLTEKYANLQPTMDKISSQIQQKLAESPVTVPVTDVKQTLLARLRPLVDNGTIAEREAEKQVTSYMARIYGSANNWDNMPDIANTMGPDGKIIPFSQKLEIPQNIPDSVLYRMKQLANDRARGLFGKENLNPAQQTTLALRNGFDDILTKYRPDIKELTMTQSDLFRAAEQGNLGGLREKSTGIGISVPGTNVKVGLPGAIADPLLRRPTAAFLNNLGENPLKTIGVAGGVAGGGILALKGAGDIINENSQNKVGAGNNPTNNENGSYNSQTGEISNNQSGNNIQGQKNHINSIAPDVNGNYNLPVQVNEGGTYMTQAKRQALEQNLTPGTPEYQKIERDYQADQERAAAKLPNNARSFMSNAPSYMDTINQADKAIKDPNVSQILKHFKTGKEWSAYMSNPDNPYAAQLSQITQLDTQFIAAYQAINGTAPGPDQLIAAGDSQEQMREKWATMLKYIYNNYNTYLEPYNALTSPGGYQTATGAPVAAPHIVQQPPSNANAIVGGNLPDLNLPQLNLPNIPQ